MHESADVIALRAAPDGVEVRHLRAFVAVAEELNFSRAAERLYLSQPALSRQIRSLERAVGCELLRRSTHRVELTLAGHALLDRARAVLAALDEAIAAAQSVGGELSARIMRLWAPVLAVATSQTSIEAIRDVFEDFLATMPMPPEIAIRPVTAGGVPALMLGDQPAILYLHGGGNVLGSAYGYRPLVGALVAAAAAGALVPDFRLAPEHPFPAAIDDALAAYRWLAARCGDPGTVMLAADSSGAGLALAVLLTLREAGERMPAGAALLCPSIDPSGALLTPRGGPQLMDEIGDKAAAYLGGHPLDDPLVSPLRADLSGLPPLLIQCATGDAMRPQGEALAERAREHGVDTRLELYPSDAHVFHVFWSFLPEAADALAQTGRFARDLLSSDHATAIRSE
ncbi:MAG: alpha/beta hydrolase fold domain-containing protein [Solirubrobacteraceae bacterium]